MMYEPPPFGLRAIWLLFALAVALATVALCRACA
jgi:hypothetical protein